jgi:beta-N-acetylhexosaminidase
VDETLRRELRFRGVIASDDLEMGAVAARDADGAVAVAALEAGCDLLLYAFHDEAVRRARLELADALVDGALDRAAFDAARPRLAAFDRRIAEPAPGELARPLADLTPPDWEARLSAIIARGVLVEGSLPAAAARGPWRVSEPAFPHGPALAESLAGEGVALAGAAEPAAELVAVMTRKPMPDDEVARLRALGARRPLVLVGLQNDAFLADVPEAALRISAADATPLTRRVVVERLVAERATAATT